MALHRRLPRQPCSGHGRSGGRQKNRRAARRGVEGRKPPAPALSAEREQTACPPARPPPPRRARGDGGFARDRRRAGGEGGRRSGGAGLAVWLTGSVFPANPRETLHAAMLQSWVSAAWSPQRRACEPLQPLYRSPSIRFNRRGVRVGRAGRDGAEGLRPADVP